MATAVNRGWGAGRMSEERGRGETAVIAVYWLGKKRGENGRFPSTISCPIQGGGEKNGRLANHIALVALGVARQLYNRKRIVLIG